MTGNNAGTGPARSSQAAQALALAKLLLPAQSNNYTNENEKAVSQQMRTKHLNCVALALPKKYISQMYM